MGVPMGLSCDAWHHQMSGVQFLSIPEAFTSPIRATVSDFQKYGGIGMFDGAGDPSITRAEKSYIDP